MKNVLIGILVSCLTIACSSKAKVENTPAPADEKQATESTDPPPVAQNDPKTVDEKTDAQNAPKTIESAAAVVEANSHNTAPEAMAPTETVSKKCEKWDSNPLFMDGHEFRYETKIESAACCDLDKDDPDWECDDGGMCERTISFQVNCKVSLTHTESYFCASAISCHTQSKYTDELSDFLPVGKWFIDDNGIYHFPESENIQLKKQTSPENCKKTEYIQCKQNTLAFEFSDFEAESPLIPFSQSKGIHKDECDDEGIVCSGLDLKHHDTTWEREESAEGGDSSSMSFALDEKRGITRFSNSFSGGSERTVTAKLQ